MEIARGLVFADVIFRRRQATAGNTSAFAGYVDGSLAELSCCWNNGRESDKSRRTGCVMTIGFSVGLLQFSLLSRSSRRSVLRTAQAIQQCGSTESN